MRRSDGRRFPPGLALAFGLVLAAAAPAGWAQSPAGEPLRQQVEARFEVLPISGGLLLRPREDMDGIRALEIRDGDLAVDGLDVSAAELERRVGREAAAPVVSLLELDGDELQALFELRPAPLPEATPSRSTVAPMPPLAPLPPLPPGLPAAERERLERELARRQEEMRREIEEAMERSSEQMDRSSEEMQRAQERIEREMRRAHRRSSGDARVVVGSTVRVRAGETSGEIVALGGGLGVDGEVLGDAVAIGGAARVDGTVSGSVVAVGGGVRLGPNARVLGDVVSVGGPLEREPGSEIAGEVIEVSLWRGLTGGWGDWGAWGGWGGWGWESPDYFDGSLGRFLRTVVSVLVLVLLGLLVTAIARGPVERVSARVTYEPLKTVVVGALAVVLFIPLAVIVAILLAVSVVGIPLLLLWPFAVLACLFLAWFGYFAAAHAVGQWSERRFGWRVSGPGMTMVLGLVLLHVWNLSARIIDVVDSAHDFGGFLRIMLWLFWALLNLGVLSAGIGALLVKRRAGPAPEWPPAHYGPLPAGPLPSSAVATGPTYAATVPPAAAPPPAYPPAAPPEPVADTGASVEEEVWEQRSWDEPFAPFEGHGDEPVAPSTAPPAGQDEAEAEDRPSPREDVDDDAPVDEDAPVDDEERPR